MCADPDVADSIPNPSYMLLAATIYIHEIPDSAYISNRQFRLAWIVLAFGRVQMCMCWLEEVGLQMLGSIKLEFNKMFVFGC